MRNPTIAVPTRFFIGLIFSGADIPDELFTKLKKNYGPVEMKMEPFRFTITNYYKQEMGEELMRSFLAFEQPITPTILPDIKHETIELEKEFGQIINGSIHRKVNIDPGYLTPAKVVLATTKNYSHRIYLRRGIFAELTYIATKSGWQTLPWTYPDYRLQEVLEFFIHFRSNELERLKSLD